MKKLLLGLFAFCAFSSAEANCIVSVHYNLASFIMPTSTEHGLHKDMGVDEDFVREIEDILLSYNYDLPRRYDSELPRYSLLLSGTTHYEIDSMSDSGRHFNTISASLSERVSDRFHKIAVKEEYETDTGYGILKRWDLSLSTTRGDILIGQFDKKTLYKELRNSLYEVLDQLPECENHSF